MNLSIILKICCDGLVTHCFFRLQSYKENGKLKLGISNYSLSLPIF